MEICIQEAQSAMDEISIRTEQIPYELLQVSVNFLSFYCPSKSSSSSTITLDYWQKEGFEFCDDDNESKEVSSVCCVLFLFLQ